MSTKHGFAMRRPNGNTRRGRRTALAITGLSLLLLPSVARAQVDLDDEERELGSAFTADLSTVWTAGNAESFTFGLSAAYAYLWEKSQFKLDAGFIKTETGTTTRRAIGTGQDDFVLDEKKERETTAEAYSIRSRYDYNLSRNFFLFGGASWLRNTFSGIDSRFLLVAGAGNTWIDNDRATFKTTYGATVTFQDDVIENPTLASTFGGLQLGYDLAWHLTSSTDLVSTLIADWNLSNTDDLRLDWANGLPISISEKLALKPEIRLLWRNDPSLAEVELFDTSGAQIGFVAVPLGKLDSFFTISLVLNL